MSDITIREITLTDYDSAALCLIDAFKKQPWNEVWTYNQAYTRIEEIMASKMARGHVIIQNSTVKGMCLGHIMTYKNFKELFIHEFSVHPSLQSKGQGSQLLDTVKETLKQEQVGGLVLNTRRDSPARSFYEKNGFKIEEPIVMMSC